MIRRLENSMKKDMKRWSMKNIGENSKKERECSLDSIDRKGEKI